MVHTIDHKHNDEPKGSVVKNGDNGDNGGTRRDNGNKRKVAYMHSTGHKRTGIIGR